MTAPAEANGVPPFMCSLWGDHGTARGRSQAPTTFAILVNSKIDKGFGAAKLSQTIRGMGYVIRQAP